MTTKKTKEKSSDFEIDARDLECPVCFETPNSIPIYKCINGHLVCNDCIPKLKECPICRNSSPPVRSRRLEKMLIGNSNFYFKISLEGPSIFKRRHRHFFPPNFDPSLPMSNT